ncbi:MAG: hypothetical protein ACYS7Y_35020 [Planctomycetota bacterium]|jgi:hypothetical protein
MQRREILIQEGQWQDALLLSVAMNQFEQASIELERAKQVFKIPKGVGFALDAKNGKIVIVENSSAT